MEVIKEIGKKGKSMRFILENPAVTLSELIWKGHNMK